MLLPSAGIEDGKLEPESAGRYPQAFLLAPVRRIRWIDKERDRSRRWENLVQEFEHLRRHLGAELRHTGNVAPRPPHALNQTKRNRVHTSFEHDWNVHGCRLRGDCCRRGGRRDYGYLALDQIGCHGRQAIGPALRPAVFDRDVTALYITQFLQTATECGQHTVVPVRRLRVKEANDWHRLLLSADNERTRNRRAEERDELAPLDADLHATPPLGHAMQDTTLYSRAV